MEQAVAVQPEQKVTSNRHAFLVWVGGLSIGLAIALWLYGWRIVMPGNVGWLLQGGDISSPFLGWDMFRRDSWHWPPGANPTLGDMAPNSIVFTDSVPFVALLLKPLRALLPDPFQYQGLVLFADFMLNGAFAALLAWRLGNRTIPALAMAVFATTATVVTARGPGGHGHIALTAHWLILAALALIWTAQAVPARRRYVLWALLAAVTSLIHFYLLVMILALWAVDWLLRWIERPQERRALVLYAVALALLLASVMYLAGYLSGAQGAMPDAVGFGVFSSNLLSFIDPASGAWFFHTDNGLTSMSVFLRDHADWGGGQYEGNAYMGAGLLLVLVIGAAYWLQTSGCRLSHEAIALGAAAALLALLAVSNVVTLGNHVLVNIGLPPLIAKLGGVVRASGRFIWVLFYVLAFGAAASIARNLRHTQASLVMLCALTIQFVDLAPWHDWLRRATDARAAMPGETRDVRIEVVMRGARRMVFLPVKDIPDDYIPFTYIAARHHMSVNATYTARSSAQMISRANETETRKLLAGDVSPDEVFVVGPHQSAAQAACARNDMRCLTLDSGMVIIRAKNALVR